MPSKKTADPFEKKLSELESIIQQMEQGSLSLDASLKAFEKGVRLSRECHKTLATAEQKVQILSGSGKETDLTPFNTDLPDRNPDK